MIITENERDISLTFPWILSEPQLDVRNAIKCYFFIKVAISNVIMSSVDHMTTCRDKPTECRPAALWGSGEIHCSVFFFFFSRPELYFPHPHIIIFGCFLKNRQYKTDCALTAQQQTDRVNDELVIIMVHLEAWDTVRQNMRCLLDTASLNSKLLKIFEFRKWLRGKENGREAGGNNPAGFWDQSEADVPTHQRYAIK